MTLVKLKKDPAGKSFNNFMDDFFAPLPSIFRDDFVTAQFKHFAPVNVKEIESGYQLEVVAPGLKKEDFKINVENDVLTVSVEKKIETEVKNEKYIRREYRQQAFKRSFTLDENIDAERIAAKYVNGVLTLNLPKKAEVKAPAKEINIQ